MSAEKFNVSNHDPKQRLKFFKHLIKLNNDTENEVAFVPHSPPRPISHRTTARVVTNESINRSIANVEREQIEATTRLIDDTGNKFAYEHENNRKIEIDASTTTERTAISAADKDTTAVPDAISNDISEQPSTDDDRGKIENQLEQRNDDDESAPLDDGHQKTVNSIDGMKSKKTEEPSSTAAATSSVNNYETQRFISELIKYKADNVTIKKSWGKWSEWSSCSRSCGEGVMFQSRECMKKT